VSTGGPWGKAPEKDGNGWEGGARHKREGAGEESVAGGKSVFSKARESCVD